MLLCRNNFFFFWRGKETKKAINKLRTDELNIEPLKNMSDNNLWEIHHPHWRTTSDDGADDARYQSNEIKINAIQSHSTHDSKVIVHLKNRQQCTTWTDCCVRWRKRKIEGENSFFTQQTKILDILGVPWPH